jgi:hypothetical protein
MAATVEASRLTEAHRLAQLRIGTRTVAQTLAAWRMLDPADLDATAQAWLAVMVPLVHSARRVSARLAANYLTTFRNLELGVDAAAFTAVLAEDVPDEQVQTSLLITGPVAVKSATGRGVPLARAVDIGKARSAGAAMRHAINGGRDTIVESVRADRRALGWARAVSGKACSFCLMLASRGPVYGEDTVGFEAHDHCSCSAEPVYRPDADWPAGSRSARDLWDATTSGLSGADAREAFRQAVGR